MTTHHQATSRLTSLLNTPSFQQDYKFKPSAFTRNRKLTFPIVVGMILRMIKQSLQITCNWLENLIGWEPASKQAFSLARQQISPECFQALHADGLETNYTIIQLIFMMIVEEKQALWKKTHSLTVTITMIHVEEKKVLPKRIILWVDTIITIHAEEKLVLQDKNVPKENWIIWCTAGAFGGNT
jgi:hypothetical protein